MDNNLSLTAGIKADKLSANQMTIENENGPGSLASLKKGQQITGTVISVEDQITLDFNGQKVKTTKDVLKNAIPGETKTFEVLKASASEIELRPVETATVDSKQTIKATVVQEDWDTILAQKEQTAKQAEKLAGKEKQLQEVKTKLEEISSKLTEQDYQLLENEGFQVDKFSIEGLYKALNRVKELSSAPKPELKSLKKESTLLEQDVAQRLKEANLPVTDENLSKIKKALELSDTATKIDDKTMRYLISQEAEPTIEKIYKAFYSGTTKNQEKPQVITEQAWNELETQVKAVILGAGYEVNQENLQDAKWLLEKNLPLTIDTFTYKKELNEIKLTTDKDMTLNKIINGMKNGTQPKNVSLGTSKGVAPEQILNDINSIQSDTISYAVQENIELTIKQLIALQETLTGENKTVKMRVNDIIAKDMKANEIIVKDKKVNDKNTSDIKVKDIKANDIKAVMASSNITSSNITSSEVKSQRTPNREELAATTSDIEISSENILSEASGEESENSNSDSQGKNTQYEEIKAHRQMEEIRLKMTLEAAAKLEKKGFSIETERLEKVVDELKELENNYYKDLLREADTEVSELSVQTLKDTTESLDRLKFTPSYVLGSTLSERNLQTIPSLLSEGSKIQSELAKAGAAYETLMTTPNWEYGDSIKKAFANMNSLLSELNIENTEQNQRAVRSLSYNQMEITEESINQVKAYDLEVTTMMQNLHPAVTVRMIKEGINPLSMPISELNSTIDRMKEEQGITSEEKFSTYLRKLEKDNGITAEERKTYVGIYRLLYNVEKSDGAALGAVIKANRDVTLEHLLTAVQTVKKGRLDAIINDEFGALQSISHEKETIAEQLSSFGGGAGQKNKEQQSVAERSVAQTEKEVLIEEQTQYLSRILKQLKEELSPDNLKETQQKLTQTDAQMGSKTSLSSTLTAGDSKLSSESGVWETIKTVPIEKLFEQLQKVTGTQSVEDELYAGKVQEIRELCKTSEQSLKFLNDFHMPNTPVNIMMANHILTNGTSPIVKALKQQNENIVENSENSLKETEDLVDTLIDKPSINEEIAKLEDNAKAALDQAYSEEKIDNRKLTELKNIGQQMTFLRTLAQKEFYQIPIETDGSITNMNLTIVRGTQSAGKVAVTAWSEQLGNIKADFSLKGQTLKGFISCDNREGLKKLQQSSGEIKAAAEEKDVSLKQLDFGLQSRESDTYSYQNPETGEQNSPEGNNAERILYRIAKAVVQTVRLAEQSKG